MFEFLCKHSDLATLDIFFVGIIVTSFEICVFLVIADLVNVFEVFLPQLLLYPNPADPLNGEAAALMMRDKTKYEQHVRGMF